MPGSYVLEVDWDGDGAFGPGDDVTQDVISIECSRGRDHASQLAGRASAGRLRATLLNDDGTYSPFNTASPLYGRMLPGRLVRLRATAPVAVTIWTGYLDTIEPGVRRAGEVPTAILTALGPFSRLAATDISLAPQQNVATGTAVNAVLDAVGWPATLRQVDPGKTVLTVWWPGKGASALAALRKLEDQEMGFLYEGEDGSIVFEDRHHRLKADHLTSQATFSDDPGAPLCYSSIQELDPLRDIYNSATLDVVTYTQQPEAVLWQASAVPISVQPQASVELWATYQGEGFVAAWADPVLGSDIVVSGVPSGDITITTSKFADAMKIVVHNNNTRQVASIDQARARGTAMVPGDPTVVRHTDAASEGRYGRRRWTFEGDFYGDRNLAQDLARYIVAKYRDPIPLLVMTLPASASDALLSQALQRRISDRITVVATGVGTQMGISGDFWIEAIEHRIGPGRRHETLWRLSDAAAESGWWVLGSSALGQTTKLAV
ncbi:hypothetical protein HRbin24_00548 [bacterium HR24]|nr:hypothetical protein HRbin24_00548 [bacterium HR24]